jgi:hypothetical protein
MALPPCPSVSLRVLCGLSLLGLAAAGHCTEPVVWEGEGVPPPQPVNTDVTVGVYIFPGWYRDAGRGDYPYRTHDEDSEWRAVARKPAPRPLLGFYDDSMPEVNDWHIKWALEHGVSFFCFDWYWNAGEHRLLRTLEQGFLRSKYCNLMKFCIHWCNHALDWHDRPGGRPSDADFQPPALVEMVNYMADRYFSRPNYLTVDGRPVLVIWDTAAVVQANGGPEGFAKAVEAMNQALRAKGFKDLYLIAMGERNSNQAAGFDAFTGYGYYGADFDSRYEWRGGFSIPYEESVKHYETVWKGIAGRPGLPYLLPIGTNWDSRPRHSERAAVIRDKTPEKFGDSCRASLKYIDRRLNMAIIEAWNEWGEGSFLEPDKQWGFGFLDQVRATFSSAPPQHTDLVPGPEKIASFSLLRGDELAAAAQMAQQPYPDPPLSIRKVTWRIDEPLPAGPTLRAWEFSGKDAEGWMPYQVKPLEVRDGLLTTTVTGSDPQLIVDNVGATVEQLACLAMRLRVPEGVSLCQLFYTTAAEPDMTADKSMTFPLVPDGQWHTYQISRAPEGKWSGALKILRLDIGSAGNQIELDWVRLIGK